MMNINIPKEKIILYNVMQDVVDVEEKLHWLEQVEDVDIPLETLGSWFKMAPVVPKEKLVSFPNGEHEYLHKFIDTTALYPQLFIAKTSLQDFPKEVLQIARQNANAFGKVSRGGLFINRAATKLANIDALLEFELTNPKYLLQKPTVAETQPLLFADICAGPGGFTEYILWRRGWNCKGFGFTLRRENDFRLEDFRIGTENFETHYGPLGDGDILNPANVKSFIQFVIENTEGQKVHFATADGGFCFEGIEATQETAARGLLVAQIYVGLSIVRPGGHFICKTFDLFTPFSVGLLYLLQKCFHKFCIHKPNTSRPANSERYLICLFKKKNTNNIELYLKGLYKELAKAKFEVTSEKHRYQHIVPFEVVEQDEQFLKYILESNNRLAIKQIFELQKLVMFCKDNSLFDPRQEELRQNCAKRWKLELDCAARPSLRSNEIFELPKERIFKIFGGCQVSSLLSTTVEENELDLDLKQIKSPYDWRVVILGHGAFGKVKRGFFFSCSNGLNYFYKNNLWVIEQVRFELPKDTLVYAEIVNEIKDYSKSKKQTLALHIIDAMILGGQNICGLHFNERHVLCTAFAKAMNKSSRQDLIPIRAKKIFYLESIDDIARTIEADDAISNKLAMCLNSNTEEIKPTSVLISGLLFLKVTNDPWLTGFDMKCRKKYWWNAETRESTFHYPHNAIANFFCTMKHKLYWKFWFPKTDDPGAAGKVEYKAIVDLVDNLLLKFNTN